MHNYNYSCNFFTAGLLLLFVTVTGTSARDPPPSTCDCGRSTVSDVFWRHPSG